MNVLAGIGATVLLIFWGLTSALEFENQKRDIL